ncbi:hypothetical protein [Actinomycetospora sp.]|jgi:hypothetical protein|uniref:hypothetical protein n=1 Tax=Actinomycetospora sp. TaxID=1872135 RepID=UPI002F3E9D23
MSSTESEVRTDTATPAIPRPREPERPDPWSPDIPAPRGIRWLDEPAPVSAGAVRDAPPAGLDTLPATRPRWLLIALTIGMVLAVVGVVAVVGIVAGTHRTMTVQGSLVVAGRGPVAPGGGCSVTTMPGHSVSIFGADGAVVGSATLPTSGTAVDQWHSASPWADACRYAFTVPDVPASDDSYRVGLDGNASDTVPFSRDELTSTGALLTYGH